MTTLAVTSWNINKNRQPSIIYVIANEMPIFIHLNSIKATNGLGWLLETFSFSWMKRFFFQLTMKLAHALPQFTYVACQKQVSQGWPSQFDGKFSIVVELYLKNLSPQNFPEFSLIWGSIFKAGWHLHVLLVLEYPPPPPLSASDKIESYNITQK